MLEFSGLMKKFGSKEVLRGVDLAIPEGNVTFVIGTSGTGKSVLMKHAVGLLVPDQGTCKVDGVIVDATDPAGLDQIRKICSYVFQGSALLDSMSLLDNVILPLTRNRGLEGPEATATAMKYLQDVGATEAAHRFPAEVGGGIRKLVAVARALAMQPRYLILDEPTTSLDAVSARLVDRLIQKLARELGVTVVVVSHDLKSIFGVADEVVFLHRGKVRVKAARDHIRTHPDLALQAFLSGKPFEKEGTGPWID